MYPIIALDGPDGTGKSTVSRELQGILSERYQTPCHLLQNPDRGGPLWEYLLHPLLSDHTTPYDPHYLQLLMTASVFQQTTRARDLAGKGPVLLDRSPAATRVYSLAEGLSREWVEALLEPLGKPDLTVILLGARFQDDAHTSIYDANTELQDKIVRIFSEEALREGWQVVYNGDRGDAVVPLRPRAVALRIAELIS